MNIQETRGMISSSLGKAKCKTFDLSLINNEDDQAEVCYLCKLEYKNNVSIEFIHIYKCICETKTCYCDLCNKVMRKFIGGKKNKEPILFQCKKCEKDFTEGDYNLKPNKVYNLESSAVKVSSKEKEEEKNEKVTYKRRGR